MTKQEARSALRRQIGFHIIVNAHEESREPLTDAALGWHLLMNFEEDDMRRDNRLLNAFFKNKKPLIEAIKDIVDRRFRRAVSDKDGRQLLREIMTEIDVAFLT